MNKLFTWLMALFFTQLSIAQDDINQLIIVNGGQPGNPLEQTNLAAFDPISMSYNVFDTIPVNAVQHIIIEGDYLYVAAQNYLVKYDLDTYERLALVDFPGVSAHQLAIHQDKLFATNNDGQTADNLYVFDANTLALIDTVQEILSPYGTMAIAGDKLYLGQNQEGNTNTCPPSECLNDTLGYLAEIDAITGKWIKNISLDNNGMETGRLVSDGLAIYTLNEVSNTITTYNISSEQSHTQDVGENIRTTRYRNEIAIIDGKIIAPFNEGIGAWDIETNTLHQVIDTAVSAFVFDYLNDVFYITATDFSSFINGYAFSGEGEHLYDFPVGFSPEAIAAHYNSAPQVFDYTAENQPVVTIPIDEIAFDLDEDSLIVVIQDAPANGIVSFLDDGDVQYNSLSLGSADVFILKVCDNKLNPLCNLVDINITSTTSVRDNLFSKVQVYPNPVASELFLKNKIEDAEYILFSALGKIIATFNPSDRILVEAIPSGNYFLQMSKDQDFKTVHFYKH